MSAANIIPRFPLNGNSPTTQSFLNRLVTQPTTARETLYGALIDGLIAAGIWTLLDCLFVFCAADQVTGLIDVCGNRVAVWPLDAGAFAANQGVTPQGSSNYLDTKFNFSTASNFKQNSCSLFGWNLTTTAIGGYGIGSGSAVESHISMRDSNGSNHTKWAICSSSEVDSGVLVSDPSGFWVANRTGVTSSELRQNGVQLATSAVASVAPSNATLQLNTNQTAQFAFLGAGAGLNSTHLGTDATASLYGLLRTFALGAGLSV